MHTSTLTRVVVITAIIAGAALGIAAIIGLATGTFMTGGLRGVGGLDVDERKSVPASGAALISIETVSERIRIQDGTGDAVEAWFHGTVHASNPDAVPLLSVDRTGSTIDIGLARKRPWNLGWHWGPLVLEVSVPKGYAGRLSVKGVSADIDLADHAYEGLALSTVSGDLKVGAVKAGDFAAHTTSGELRASAVTAERLELSSVSGGIEVKSMTGNVRAHTTSGEVTLAFEAAPPEIEIGSTSGEVTLRFPADAGFRLDARSTSGDVTCGFPIQISESRTGGGQHALTGMVGSGSSAVTVRTVSGGIRVQR